MQEAGFPGSMRRRAKELDLRGWVRNTEDGRVEAVFEGEPEAVRKMIEWCYRDRPSGAEVHYVCVERETPSRDITSFEVR